MAEPDPRLREIERGAFWAFAIMVVLAVATGGGIRAVAGVVGGALLVAVSYRAIHAGVDAAVLAGSRKNRRSTIWRLVKFITRFAILGLIAYVMMVRLRAHPVWMLLGASSLVAAAALEAVRAPRARVLGQPSTEHKDTAQPTTNCDV
jgi:hypothetical protein